MSKKKKILYHSDFSLVKSGFGKAARLVLTHLYNTGKYEIVHFCCGLHDGHKEYDRLPWKSLGALPNFTVDNRDPKVAQMSSYGSFTIDSVMKKERPDVYIGVQDIWGCDFALEKSWFTPENMAIWTTLDSLPILPSAVTAVEKSKNFWCWSDFATNSLHELGHKYVRTMRGPLETKDFYKLDDEVNRNNRDFFGIPQDAFIIGFVFRNQLRKSVPNLLEGYKKFLDNNPEIKNAKLLLHTNFSEGWGIHKLAAEVGVDTNDILTTYTCGTCQSFGVHNFKGQGIKCPHCQTEKSYSTTSVAQGVTEAQLNQVYNLMDVYTHPFTSGGQEIPIQEAKLTELITLVTNYSCGEDNCVPEAQSLPLEWSRYREHQTEFIKASTDSDSIAEELLKVYNMPEEDRKKMGALARKWVEENFAIEVIGKKLEEFIDSARTLDKDKTYTLTQTKDPEAEVDNTLEDEEYIISMYKKILDMKVDKDDEGHKYWMKQIGGGAGRPGIEKYFRETATKEMAADGDPLESFKDSLEFSEEEEKSKKILYVIPESAGDIYLSTSLFKSLKDTYPEFKLFVATKLIYQDILLGNPYVHRAIEFDQQFMEATALQGWSNRMSGNIKNLECIFDIVLLAHINVQRIDNYTRNGLDKIAFDIVHNKGDN